MFRDRFTHLRSFPLNYEISTEGIVRKRISNGFVYFERNDTSEGTFVTIEKHGKVSTHLLADLMLLSFEPSYLPGYIIIYRDGNINNVKIINLKSKKQTSMLKPSPVDKDAHLIGLWRCQSRADSANQRYKHLVQIITPIEVLRSLMITEYKCFYCGCDLNKHSWHLDHYTPKSKGGKNSFENLRPSCKKCNTAKSDMPYEQFMRHVIRVYEFFKKVEPQHPLFTRIGHHEINQKDNG